MWRKESSFQWRQSEINDITQILQVNFNSLFKIAMESL